MMLLYHKNKDFYLNVVPSCEETYFQPPSMVCISVSSLHNYLLQFNILQSDQVKVSDMYILVDS